MRGRQPEEQLPRASLAASVGAINLRIPKLRAAIAAVPGMNRPAAENVWNFLHPGD